jgi:hypothetical protein
MFIMESFNKIGEKSSDLWLGIESEAGFSLFHMQAKTERLRTNPIPLQ